MTRIWIGLLMFAIGCSPAAKSSSNGSADLEHSESNEAKVTSKATRQLAPPDLTVGSPAPPLKLGRFLKGEPVTSLELGKVYVLEFWATWCGPCIEAMPHISELQAKYPKVTFIGVNVWEEDDSAAEQFIKANGQNLKYRIARDDVPEGGGRNDGAMAKTWLAPAEVNSIPTAIVIDAKGRIANITHPMALEECLPQIIKGTWDLDAAAQQRLLSESSQRARRKFNERMQALAKSEPTDETPEELDRIAEEFPDQADILGLIKFKVLVMLDGKTEQTLAAGRTVLKGELGGNPQALNEMALAIVAPERPKQAAEELNSFALEVAKKMDNLVQKKNPIAANTLARALFVNGDARGAANAQRRAIQIAESDPRSKGMVSELQKTLDEYEEAASAAKPE